MLCVSQIQFAITKKWQVTCSLLLKIVKPEKFTNALISIFSVISGHRYQPLNLQKL